MSVLHPNMLRYCLYVLRLTFYSACAASILLCAASILLCAAFISLFAAFILLCAAFVLMIEGPTIPGAVTCTPSNSKVMKKVNFEYQW
jgi:hypothetical protein